MADLIKVLEEGARKYCDNLQYHYYKYIHESKLTNFVSFGKMSLHKFENAFGKTIAIVIPVKETIIEESHPWGEGINKSSKERFYITRFNICLRFTEDEMVNPNQIKSLIKGKIKSQYSKNPLIGVRRRNYINHVQR